MIKKFCIFLITSLLVSFMTPLKSYACETKTTKAEKSCCLKEKPKKSKKDICCGKHKITGKNEDTGCGGNCDNLTCSSPSTFSILVMPNFTVKVDFSTLKARKIVKSFYTETYNSSGFGFIWTPPNIV